MADDRLAIIGDFERAIAILASLAEALERFPELGNRIVDFLESGQQIFFIDSDDRTASGAGEVIVRLNPSYGFLILLAAFRAGNPEFCFLEHAFTPVSTFECISRAGDVKYDAKT